MNRSLIFFSASGLALIAASAMHANIIFSTYDGVTATDSRTMIYLSSSDFGQRAGISFTTSADSFTLDSVTVNMSLNRGSASDFILSLYSNSGVYPGTRLGTLTGPDSMTSRGNFTFAASGLSLAASTTYWILAEPDLATAPEFSWYKGTSPAPYMTSHRISSSDWGPWLDQTVITPAIVVNATPVPEPATMIVVAVLLVPIGVNALRTLRTSRKT